MVFLTSDCLAISLKLYICRQAQVMIYDLCQINTSICRWIDDLSNGHCFGLYYAHQLSHFTVLLYRKKYDIFDDSKVQALYEYVNDSACIKNIWFYLRNIP